VREVTLSPVTVDHYLRSFPSLFHPMIPVGLPRRPRPAYLARRDAAWWSKTLSRGRGYLAYNVTTFDTDPLARRLLRLAARARVRRVVIDLRHNPGGNNATYWDLLQALRDRRINRSGRLVVLIGRTTFSAAANFATEVDRRTNAVFVGEPTGGSPNLYGDPEAVRLPVSGWNTNVATIYWQKSSRGDRRVAIDPDVRVELTAAAFFAGRDPVLEAALRVRR
jgi:C-terminal processing protease CtpA/Prc